MQTSNTVTIILNQVEADKFRLYQKHYDLITKVIESGVFELAFGKVIFNVAFNEIQNIVRESMIWKR